MITTDIRTLGLGGRSVSLTRQATASLAFAAALALAAQMRLPLPFTPVPITLQTFALYLGAAWLGPRLAISGLGIYVGGALLGLPVMSGLRGGAAAFAGATGGYILGWFVAAMVLARLLDGGRRSWAATVGAMALASVLILSFGTLHLMLLLRLTPWQAFIMGVAPFIPGDTLKILTAAALVRRRPNPLALR